MAIAYAALPGGDLVEQGLGDLRCGVVSVEGLLVAIGRPRLVSLGVDVPSTSGDAEHALYRLLAASGAETAHGRYNALVRRLVSFERALACVR